MFGKLELKDMSNSISKLDLTSNKADFQITVERLNDLKIQDPDLNEEEEDEILIPSDYAYNEAVRLLNNLYEILGESFPRGFCSVESRGGVNLIWRNQEFDNKIRIMIPYKNDVNNSLYYLSGEESVLIEELTLSDIRSRFLMFLNEN